MSCGNEHRSEDMYWELGVICLSYLPGHRLWCIFKLVAIIKILDENGLYEDGETNLGL